MPRSGPPGFPHAVDRALRASAKAGRARNGDCLPARKAESEAMRAIPSLLLFLAAPASAGGATPLPEPSNLALFGLGVAGLVIGRRMAAKRKSSDKD